MKVLTVVGARPQFVKAFAVSRRLREDHEEVLVHTGQHYDENLSAVFFEELGIPEPEYNLGVGSASHGTQTGRMMIELESVLQSEQPDVVLVYGDTNSTLAAAMVAAKADPELAHVEAGLRSDNRQMPEEHNRVLTDHAADLLFAPTDRAVATLESEGLGERTCQSGDVMYDTLLWARERASQRSSRRAGLGIETEPYLLATIHRAGNTDDPERLRSIFDALADRPEEVVFPAHPRTKTALREIGALERVRRELTVLDPVGYFEFVDLLAEADSVVTDSGGVQKEAFFLETSCVTVRSETEWPETVEAGWNVLVDPDSESIHRGIDRTVQVIESDGPQPFGDGNAAGRIKRHLERHVSDTGESQVRGTEV